MRSCLANRRYRANLEIDSQIKNNGQGQTVYSGVERFVSSTQSRVGTPFSCEMTMSFGSNRNFDDGDDPRGSDRGLSAFRYVSGEMDVAEVMEFESLLRDDAELCDAVAQAVLLVEGLNATHSVGTIPPRTEREVGRSAMTWDSRIIWTISILSCCLIVGLLLSGRTAGPRSTERAQIALEAKRRLLEQRDLVDVYSVLHQSSHDELDDVEEYLPGESLTDVDRFDTRDDESVEVPDWMIAAVALDASDDAAIPESTLSEDELDEEVL